MPIPACSTTTKGSLTIRRKSGMSSFTVKRARSYTTPKAAQSYRINEGLLPKFTRLYLKRDSSEMSEAKRESIDRFLSYSDCSLCGGSRLNQEALGCRINGYNIAQCAAMEIGELIHMIGAIRDPVAGPMIDGILTRLNHLVSIGLEYLSLDRQTATFSGGESQRIKMVRHLSSSLTDMIYIFDEPSVGLYPRDVHRLNGMVCQLRDKGNTVLVVEQDREVMENIRSNSATYTGMMDEIRRQFAAANKVSASLFSFNSKGACSNCQGLGMIYTDLAFLEPIRTTCEICAGRIVP